MKTLRQMKIPLRRNIRSRRVELIGAAFSGKISTNKKPPPLLPGAAVLFSADCCEFSLPLQILLQEPPLVLCKSPFLYRLPHFRHHVEVELDVVDAGKGCRQDLVGVEEVVYVGPGEVAAGVA